MGETDHFPISKAVYVLSVTTFSNMYPRQLKLNDEVTIYDVIKNPSLVCNINIGHVNKLMTSPSAITCQWHHWCKFQSNIMSRSYIISIWDILSGKLYKGLTF